MSKDEYLNLLKKQLRRLPREDFQKAVEYFEEYFEDAGVGQEQQAIEDLGSPQEAADQIIRDLAVENSKNPIKGVRKRLGAVWVGILAVFAAPLALPFILVLVALVVCVVITLLAFFVSIIAVGVVLVISAPVLIVAGFSVINSIPNFLSCVGYGLFSGGLGVLITYGIIILCRKFLNGMVRIFGRVAGRGGKKA